MKSYVPVPGYQSVTVSDDGQVFSSRSGQLIRLAERMNRDGYLCVNVKAYPGRMNNKKVPVHRLVLLAWHGEAPVMNGRVVCRHLYGVKTNNNKDNLRWGTDKDNHDDALRHGTLGHGMLAPRRKLTDEQVVVIRRMICDRVPYRKIAEEFGITKDYVYQLKVGKAW